MRKTHLAILRANIGRAFFLALLIAALLFYVFLFSNRAAHRAARGARQPSLAPIAEGRALIISTHAAFCEPATADPTPELKGAFARVLFEGSPRYWMVPPNEFSFLVTEGTTEVGVAIVTSFLKQYGPFQEYFRDSPPDALMVDVGANIGLASMPVAAMGREVIAFEPVPSNQRAYMLSVCVNGFAGHVTLVGAAVGASSGSADIFVPRGRADNTALGKDVSTANVGGEADSIRVPVVTLDAILRPEDVRRIWLLKIDVQGYELRVLEGARAVLGALPHSAWVVAEHDPKLMAASGLADTTADIAFMASLGFSAHLTWKGDAVPQSGWATVPLEEYGRDMWYKKL